MCNIGDEIQDKGFFFSFCTEQICKEAPDIRWPLLAMRRYVSSGAQQIGFKRKITVEWRERSKPITKE